MGVLQNGWFIRELPIKMEDWGVPLFQETTIYTHTSHPFISKYLTPFPIFSLLQEKLAHRWPLPWAAAVT